MRGLIPIFFCSLFLCCTSEEKQRIYTISDLHFPEDNLRKARMQNHVSQSYFYMQSAYYHDKYYGDLNNKCDSEVTLYYDKNGNTIRDINGHYEYNDWNMMIHANAGRCLASSWNNYYLFNSKARILHIFNYGDPPYKKSKHPRKHTSSIYFDKEGKVLLWKTEQDSTVYQYNTHGDIQFTKGYNFCKQYFYTGRKLDSVYIENIDGGRIITDKQYYDKNTLLHTSIEYQKHCPYCPIYDVPYITYSVKNIVDSIR